MCPKENIPHKFDLTGMKPRDWFIGCPECWFHVEPRAASVLTCPVCKSKMLIYDVTEDDVKRNP